jgi:hypothetical protein
MASVAAVAVAVLAAAFFAPGIFAGEVPTYRDFVNVFLPYKLYAARALAEGRFPLWAPEAGLGAPFHAAYQAGLLYPPSGILFLLPNASGVGLYLALHVWLGGFGMARLLARRGLGGEARLFGAVVYAFGGTFLSALPWGHAVVAAWMPWAIVAAEDVVGRPSASRFLCLVAVLALELLGGAPETFLQSAALVLAQALVARGTMSAVRRVGVVSLAAALALAVAAAQLLPTAEALGESERLGGMASEVVSLFSFEPASLLTLVVPHRMEGGIVAPIPEHGFPLFWSVYVGLVPLPLAALALASRSGRRFGAVLLVSLALALGNHAPIFPFLYGVAPGLVGLFRYPEKFLLTVHLALSALAGIGLGRMQSWMARETRLPVSAVSLAIVALTMTDLWNVHRPAMLFSDFGRLLASAPPLELRPVDEETRLFHYEREGERLKPWNPKFTIGEDLGDFERRVWADLGANVGLVYRVGFVADAGGIRERRIADLYRFLRSQTVDRALHVLSALGVRFLVGPDPIEAAGLEPLRRGDERHAWIYRLRSAGPHAYLASRVRSVGTLQGALERLADEDFVPGEDATVEGDCPSLRSCSRSAIEVPGERSIRLVESTAERLVLDVAAAERALLVVGDSFYPGWHARVDGSLSRLFRANGLVRAVIVPSGRHVVTLEYEPLSFRFGLLISGTALFVTGLAGRRIKPLDRRS